MVAPGKRLRIGSERRLAGAVFRRPWLYPKQLAAIYDDHRYSFIEASSKAGKTWACLVWLAEQAFLLGGEELNFWWVAPVYKQAKIAYRRLKRALPRELGCKFSDGEMTIVLPNGARITFQSGENPDNLFGDDVYAAVIDEASRMREETWHAVRSTLTATRGKIRVIGNVKGRRNWFFKMARRAEAGNPNMGYHKITWHDAVAAGIMEKEEVEDAKDVLPEAVFMELYEAEATEDGSNPFGIESIRLCIIPERSKRPVIGWGWDFAKKRDWTAGVALDSNCNEVDTDRFQKLPWPDTEKRVHSKCRGKPALVDSTGIGDSTLDHLKALPGGAYEGFIFTNSSKQDLVQNLALEIQKTRVGLTDKALIGELESFEYQVKNGKVIYAAPEGMTDDLVFALALAVKKVRAIAQPFAGSSLPKDRSVAGEPSPEGRGDEGQTWSTIKGWEDREALM